MNLSVMKMELTQTIGIRAKAEYALDLVIDILLELKEFTVFHGITFGETFFFLLSIFRAIWYLSVEVKNANYDYLFSESTWTIFFVAISLINLIGFFFQKIWVRLSVVVAYAFVWCFLCILAGLSGTTAPAVPTFAAFTLGSTYLAARLWRDSKREKISK